MLKPKLLNEILEKNMKQFNISRIFITNQEGQLVACTPQHEQPYYISCLSNLWMDFYIILENLGQDDRLNRVTLNHE